MFSKEENEDREPLRAFLFREPGRWECWSGNVGLMYSGGGLVKNFGVLYAQVAAISLVALLQQGWLQSLIISVKQVHQNVFRNLFNLDSDFSCRSVHSNHKYQGKFCLWYHQPWWYFCPSRTSGLDKPICLMIMKSEWLTVLWVLLLSFLVSVVTCEHGRKKIHKESQTIKVK